MKEELMLFPKDTEFANVIMALGSRLHFSELHSQSSFLVHDMLQLGADTVQAIHNVTCRKPSRIRTNKFEVLQTKTKFV